MLIFDAYSALNQMLRLNQASTIDSRDNIPVSCHLRFFGLGLCLACARSDPATDRTVALLLVRRSFEALDASRFDVVISTLVSGN
jgi:hypothetical protein